MASTPEKKVKEKIKALLKQCGAYYRLDVKTGMASNGDPDFDVCYQGYFAGIEAKAGKGQPSALQWVRLTEILNAGGTALIINENNLADLEQWLRAPHEPISNLCAFKNPLEKSRRAGSSFTE